MGGDEGSSVDGLGLRVEVGVRAAFGLAGRRTKRGRGVEKVRGGRWLREGEERAGFGEDSWTYEASNHPRAEQSEVVL